MSKLVKDMLEELRLVKLLLKKFNYASLTQLERASILQHRKLMLLKRRKLKELKGQQVKRKYKKLTKEQALLKKHKAYIRHILRIELANKQILLQGLRDFKVCTRCLKAKPYSAFGKKKNGLFNVLCDKCRISIIKSSRPLTIPFSLDFFRQKAYSANKSSQVGKKCHGITVGISSQQHVIQGEDICMLYAKQSGSCYYCGVSLLPNFHMDHKLPRSKGGLNIILNIALTCPECNKLKGNKTEAEFTSFLLPYAQRILKYREQDKELAGNNKR